MIVCLCLWMWAFSLPISHCLLPLPIAIACHKSSFEQLPMGIVIALTSAYLCLSLQVISSIAYCLCLLPLLVATTYCHACTSHVLVIFCCLFHSPSSSLSIAIACCHGWFALSPPINGLQLRIKILDLDSLLAIRSLTCLENCT